MRTSYNHRDDRDRRSERRNMLLGLVALLLAIVALGLAGRVDYEDRCAALSPAASREVQASCVTSR